MKEEESSMTTSAVAGNPLPLSFRSGQSGKGWKVFTVPRSTFSKIKTGTVPRSEWFSSLDQDESLKASVSDHLDWTEDRVILQCEESGKLLSIRPDRKNRE
jgi:hypothetical protein